MQMPQNTFKSAIAQHQLQLGLFSLLAHPISAEVVAGSGFDWMIIDTEHGPGDVLTVMHQLQAMQGSRTHAAVRPAANDKVLIKRLLDTGVQTLLIPHVDSAEEARAAVQAVRFPEGGLRGIAPVSRAANYGRITDYVNRAAQEICVLVQIESASALRNLEEIAGVDGVDGLFIGPGDLAGEVGYLGQPNHPAMRRLYLNTIRRIRACGKPAGIVSADQAFAQECVDAGAAMIVAGADLLCLRQSCDTLAEKFRTLVPATDQIVEGLRA
ncbi:HpcH/HpaI aldolase/citrate lyase family protein [Viridibacterium curvum]|uniref:4-hydroxy-2-oxoheptanedioate aldolase n=1 Tax=Viridibacterium curvum TaxID=1101404 RepID=A0ABP9QHD4_9RHOO